MEPHFLTVKDVSQMLSIKANTLYCWALRGKIPSLRINGVVRFDKNKISDWLKDMQRDSSASTPLSSTTNNNTGDIDKIIENAKSSVLKDR